MKRALVTGITGQDGSYLAELLLSKGYEVHGLVRRSSLFNTSRIDHLYQDPHDAERRLFLHHGDLTDGSNVARLVESIQPEEIYNLGAQSHVKVSFEVPEYTADVDAVGVIRLLDAVRRIGGTPKYYQASTSELYGDVAEIPQTERTPFRPRSPYAAAKLYAYWVTANYREAYGLKTCNGILFNHESPRRGQTFVTRKITRAVGRIKHGLQGCLYLGNLDAKRDWGYAPDYIEGMWRMLQLDEPQDLVLATGECHTVEEFCQLAFERAGIPLEFSGSGADRVGVDEQGMTRVSVDVNYYRPAEVDLLVGDASRAREVLGWEPTVKFAELVNIMTDADLDLARQEASASETLPHLSTNK